MKSEYTVKGKDYFTAEVNDIVLDEKPSRRLIFRPEIVRNATDASASIHGHLLYQRKSSGSADWEDEPPFDLRKVKAGQTVGLYLDAAEMQKLHEELDRLYQLPVGVNSGMTHNYVVVDESDSYVATGRHKELIENLLEKEGEEFWDHIEELSPGLVKTVTMKWEVEAKKAALAEFEEHLAANDWNEPKWQKFFRDNTWIFGHNLLFQFITPIEDQAHVGGTTLTGKGGQDADYLLSTEADARFTVIVDIKRPDADLVESAPYRNKVHQVGSEVIGGVGQVQSYLRRWVMEGSQQEDNREFLLQRGIYTYEPRGILIVGHLGQLDNRDKLASFELFRRNTINPEIITFDEILERARYTIKLLVAEVDTEVPQGSTVELCGASDRSRGEGAEASKPDLTSGQVVVHGKFGRGVVVNVIPRGIDYRIVVDFDSHGRKHLLKSLAGLETVEEQAQGIPKKYLD